MIINSLTIEYRRHEIFPLVFRLNAKRERTLFCNVSIIELYSTFYLLKFATSLFFVAFLVLVFFISIRMDR